MPAAEQVHWRHGLFLQPHHLQMMQRHLMERIADLRRHHSLYSYGILQWDLDEEAITKARVVRFRTLHAVMKSGVEVRYFSVADAPTNAELQQLDIGPAFDSSSGSLTISLAVPSWQPHRPNAYDPSTGDTQRADALYIVRQSSLLDENEPNDPRNERSVEVRRINARLVINATNLNGFELLPLLKIRRGVQGELLNKPVRDTTYVPPTLFVGSSNEIQAIAHALSENVKSVRKDMAKKLVSSGFDLLALREAQVGGVIKLQTLNRVAARLPALLESQNIPLYDLYLELRTVLADFLALAPEQDSLFDFPRYQHENPYLAISELCEQISKCIPPPVSDDNTSSSIVFEDKLGRLVARLTDDQVTSPTTYYLSVFTSTDPKDLVKAVEGGSSFKLKAASRVGDSLLGVKLVQDVNPHVSLNRQPGLLYFRVERVGREAEIEWRQICLDKEIALKRQSSNWYPDARYTLHMIMPVRK